MVILGTQYAGEMKKGIFTVMHYLMPKRGILSLHSGCNVGKNDDVTLFFGLSGTVTKLLLTQITCGWPQAEWKMHQNCVLHTSWVHRCCHHSGYASTLQAVPVSRFLQLSFIKLCCGHSIPTKLLAL